MIVNWIKDIYQKHGYVAALVTIIVLVALMLGVSWFAGIDLQDLGRWLIAIGG